MKTRPHASHSHLMSLTPRFSEVVARRCTKNRFNGFRPVLLLLALPALIPVSTHAQQALDQKSADPALDSPITVIAETPYAVATRDGNQKIWSRTTWESNS